MTELDVCLVAHFAFGALGGGERGHVGGVEHQTSLLARWLASRGHRISLVTWDEGQPDGVEIDGVRVYTLCRRDAGLPGLRFVHPRWTSLIAALRRADARIYYQNCGEYVTGQVALEARRRRRAFVYSVASDPDCDARLPGLPALRERLLYRYGLRRADRVIVQTRRQQRLLQEGFGRASVVLPMPCAGPARDALPPRRLAPGAPRRVLWIGRLAEVKRPDRLLDVAQACPELRFDVVGPPEDPAAAAALLERARSLANVTYHGRVARDGVAAFYERADALLCTSEYEGFPNTFLEAWSHGVPTVSTVDPDGLIAEQGLGAHAPDRDGLAAALRRLLGSAALWEQASSRARAYFLDHHALDRSLPRFEALFREVAAARA